MRAAMGMRSVVESAARHGFEGIAWYECLAYRRSVSMSQERTMRGLRVARMTMATECSDVG